MPILELHGTLDISQFWPDGTSDADTARVHVDRVKYAGRVTHVLDHAIVMPIGKPAINKRGLVTVRLQGIDAPELHYRPQVRDAKVNGQFRQYVAETATIALRELLGDNETAGCRVRTAVTRPSDVFDCYGRLVGDVQLRRRGKWVSLNEWLVRRGWAFPALYESMTIPEIKRMRSLAASARRRGWGVWAHYTTDADRFDRHLVFRAHGVVRADRGRVSLPKMFRRASTWSVLESPGSFAEYLHARPDPCYPTAEFLRGRRERARLECYLSDHGRLRVAPADLVFSERESALVDGRGAEIREW